MKKYIIIFLGIALIITALILQIKPLIYSNNDAMTIASEDDEIKILQLTDLHLTYGIDYRDNKTFDLIETLVKADSYDLVVFTGDLTMSFLAPQLYSKLISLMESLETPWTFVFGNHDTDLNRYQAILNRLKDTQYLYFKIGPELENGGYGNFKINFTYQNQIIYAAYFLDSKNERTDFTEEEGEYDYLSTSQVNWYKDFVSTDTVESVVFMHIPLRQMMDPVSYDGNFLEIKVYAQGVDTGFFDAMVTYQKSKAAFFGHDHLNDFTTTVDDILLAYGRATGYNGYGYLDRGGRVISIKNNIITTYIVTESEPTA